jgi:hypothetical protein
MLDKLRSGYTSLAGRACARPTVFLWRCKRFLEANDGIATVEWVALAAGCVIGSIVVSFIIMQGLAGAATAVADQLKPAP